MPDLIALCPRCGENKTLAVVASLEVDGDAVSSIYETFCFCHACGKSTIFVLGADESLGKSLPPEKYRSVIRPGIGNYNVLEYITSRHFVSAEIPAHVDNKKVVSAFEEGATCLASGCYNAATIMLRSCLELVAEDVIANLSADENTRMKQERININLEKKLQWLFDNGKMPVHLHEQADCIRKYGNASAHELALGKTKVAQADAELLLLSVRQLLEQCYTMPKRIAHLREKEERRKNAESKT